MKSKILKAIGAGSLVLGMVALSGCYETSYPAYSYGYGGGRSYYVEPAPVVVRDYGHRDWRDRDDNDRRNERVTVNHDHDRAVHASADRDHDRDRN